MGVKSSPSVYILLMIVRALSIPVDNGVDGDPEIECGPTTIAINFSTRKQFEGHVYVKPRFITKVDRAFRISCFYMEASKDVGSQIDVSEMTTASVTHMVQMPVCRYDILEGGPNGIPVEFGKIGQQVYHRWSCASETVNTFCMLVHSCSVDDGKGDRVAILDSDGCAMDRYLLNNLEYPEDLLAGQECVRPTCPDLLSSSPVTVFNKNRQAQGLPAHRIGDSAITKSTPLPFSLPVAGYIQGIQDFPRRHQVHVDGVRDRPYLDSRIADSRLVRMRRSTSSKYDDSFTVDVRAEITALGIVDEKSKQEFRDVCLSERLFVTSTCFVLGIFLCLIAVMVLFVFRNCISRSKTESLKP
ncbi:hypothetical protein Y032_0297g1735 [Ancylostoma ceylanicum]|uniref:ZP domain-containing protein n=2 Tax=Ancylostoma ceylanicum TaxID=53326 RepID=A0A016S580_9BILA|nr:hypothetical protein Y032_0297g1735 [Ancylostoma ceylanicum]